MASDRFNPFVYLPPPPPVPGSKWAELGEIMLSEPPVVSVGAPRNRNVDKIETVKMFCTFFMRESLLI